MNCITKIIIDLPHIMIDKINNYVTVLVGYYIM